MWWEAYFVTLRLQIQIPQPLARDSGLLESSLSRVSSGGLKKNINYTKIMCSFRKFHGNFFYGQNIIINAYLFFYIPFEIIFGF